MESERRKYISVLVWLAVLLVAGCAAPPMPPSDADIARHEWDTSEADRPRLVTDESGREEYDGTEKPENLVTWVYDGTSFTPVAKVTNGERYTIVHDYLGTPTQAYDGRGNLVWEMLLDVYGEVKECHGDRTLVPFRYQGQYEDEETGLYYNRFRYYSSQMGMYISSDPIGLAGNNPTLYGYVKDVNVWLDICGLKCFLDTPKKKANTADIDDIIRTPDTHPEDFSSIKGSPNYRNDYTGEIWSPSHTNHSHSSGGEWKVGIGKNVNPTPRRKITVSSDGTIIKKDL